MKSFIAIALTLGLSGAAFATSTHQVLKVAPVKKDGKTVGAAFTVLLKPDGHKSARVGLGFAGKNANEHYPVAYVHVKDAAKGYMAAPLETVPTAGPTQRVMKVMYGQGNSLKAGDSVEVYSFWDEAHLWGSNRHETIKEPTFTLPGDK